MKNLVEKIKHTTLKQRVATGAIVLLLLGGGTGLAVNRHNEKVLADSQAKIVKADKKANLEKHLKADKEAKIKADKEAKAKAEADKQAKLKAESEAKAKAEADKQAQVQVTAQAEQAQAVATQQAEQAQAQVVVEQSQAQAQATEQAQATYTAPEQQTPATPSYTALQVDGGAGAYANRTQADRDRDAYNASVTSNYDGTGKDNPWGK